MTSVRFQNDRPVLGLAGVETMNDAEALAGYELRVPVETLAGLPRGTFYRRLGWMPGADERRNGSGCGARREARCTAVGWWFRALMARLIPLVTAICTNIDVAAKRIVIEPPEGAARTESIMTFDIVTIFPAMVEPLLTSGVLGRAIAAGVLDEGPGPPRLHTRPAPRRGRYGMVAARYGAEARADFSRAGCD